ncbi:hypothetical protein [Streptomyces decoyicus]|uniref:hypothetical protein n=1 Tax=Streptomyces decoyicus TaxID=249567 RepID=UPI00364F00AB
MTATVPRVCLAAEEVQVVEGLADGITLPELPFRLAMPSATADRYLTSAKRKLHVRENATAVATALAVEAIERPQPLDYVGPNLLDGQRALMPLFVQGMSAEEMADQLQRPLTVVRRDGRQLMRNVQAKNPSHLVKRLWRYRLVSTERVLAWLA